MNAEKGAWRIHVIWWVYLLAIGLGWYLVWAEGGFTDYVYASFLTLLCGPILLLSAMDSRLVRAFTRAIAPRSKTARRVRKEQCPQCGYSTVGLPRSAPCPECGFVPLVPRLRPSGERHGRSDSLSAPGAASLSQTSRANRPS